MLLGAAVPTIKGLDGVARIAEWEHWAFEYLPDGTVLFKPLPEHTRLV
jgi:hypothetical protein